MHSGKQDVISLLGFMLSFNDTIHTGFRSLCFLLKGKLSLIKTKCDFCHSSSSVAMKKESSIFFLKYQRNMSKCYLLQNLKEPGNMFSCYNILTPLCLNSLAKQCFKMEPMQCMWLKFNNKKSINKCNPLSELQGYTSTAA